MHTWGTPFVLECFYASLYEILDICLLCPIYASLVNAYSLDYYLTLIASINICGQNIAKYQELTRRR